MSEFHPITPDTLLFRGRKFRRESTFPKWRLWNALRGRRLCGLKFRRQHPIGRFIVDFYSDENRLVIELDGNSHNDRADYDLEREEFLKSQNLRILRFGNDDVLRDLEAVLCANLIACGIDPNSGAALTENTRPSP